MNFNTKVFMKKSRIVFLLCFAFITLNGIANKKTTLKVIDKTLSFSVNQSFGLYQTILEMPNRLPRNASSTGELTTSNDAWWTSGFFPGTLWLLYDFSKNEEMKIAAQNMTKRLVQQQYTTDNHDVGFMINCSYGNGLALTSDNSYKEVIINAAKSLATRFSPVTGTIKSWDKRVWAYPVIIDNMMNLELLTLATRLSGDSSYYKIAVSHADTTLKYHFRPDFSSYHVVNYDPEKSGIIERVTFQGFADSSAWARGQSWGLYGYTMMYRETKKIEYLEQAIKIAEFIANHPNLPKDKIPYWDFDAPNIPNELRDASAAAVIASALVELSTFTNKELSKKYLDLATQMILSLSSKEYLANLNTNSNFILKHSVGFMAKNSEVDAALTYADYYFIEAMLRYRNLVNR